MLPLVWTLREKFKDFASLFIMELIQQLMIHIYSATY